MNAPLFFRLVIQNMKVIQHLKLHSQIEQLFAKLLLLHPFTEKEKKVWDKFKNNHSVQLGLLSRKLIKSAKAVKLSSQLIMHYLRSKQNYKYYKQYEYKEINHNQALDLLIHEVYRFGRDTQSATSNINEFHSLTRVLLQCVIDKSEKQIAQLAQQYD